MALGSGPVRIAVRILPVCLLKQTGFEGMDQSTIGDFKVVLRCQYGTPLVPASVPKQSSEVENVIIADFCAKEM